MSAGIGNRHLEIGIHLFCRFNGDQQCLAIIDIDATGVRVQNEIRIYEVAVILEQPVDAVRVATLLIGSQRKNNVAVRLVAFFPQADEIDDHDCVIDFHVLRAAAVIISILLDKFERICRPVLGTRFHDVQVANNEDRLFRASAPVADYEILLAIIGTENLHVSSGKAGVEQTLLHGFRGRRDVADGIRRVDLD